ncbi:MAG: DUF3237 domain-containing protein [Sphingomonadaceae bacterium]|nr:DUF3237 domain-containing protein [Sphingomonadaceae bacterium]
MPTLETEFLYTMRVKIDPVYDLGLTPNGRRLVAMVGGGTFEGPRMKGIMLPLSGADWALDRPDGSSILDVRVNLRTDDGADVLMTSLGYMVAHGEDYAYALDFAKPDDPEGASRYYFRTSPRYETSDARYAWLNHTVAAAKGRTGNGGVIYDVFAVL